MPTDHRQLLAGIRRFDQLVAYLRDELDWPISTDPFEELTFEYTPEELGIDAKNAAQIQDIKRLRPLVPNQPWGIFFIKFEPKRLPVVALRRILGRVALKKRTSINSAEHQAWATDDLLFVSNYGEGNDRRITFAHFSKPGDGQNLPTLKVLGWDNLDTSLHLDAVARELNDHLRWPNDEDNLDDWRERWRAAFTLYHREVITTSRTLSERLAVLARTIRDRIKTTLDFENENGSLTQLMKAFQTALVNDLDKAGFADMYAQTIAYGLLSARIANPTRRTIDDFADHMRTNPFLKELLETFLKIGGRRHGNGSESGIDFDELGVSEVVELLDQAKMEAVIRDFGDRNPQEDPVIHFYEHFLAAYDKNQKVSRGVFYTPRPVVSYIVRSVDELLRSEFGLADGLADTTTWGEMAERYKELKIPVGMSPNQAFVQILDPATGTGTFLVEVIDLIHRTMQEKWKVQGRSQKKIQALWNEYVPKHLLSRLHGYELLMAPYAIAHVKVGLKLFETGYQFANDERARVYLTNALEPPGDGQIPLGFLPALAHEAAAVNEIKRNQRFTAIIGNPPYAGHSRNNQVSWVVDKVYDYKRNYPDLQKPGQGKWLQDDYVKFLRMAEWWITSSKIGILGFITNHAWLDNPTFKGMRKHLIQSFDRRTILDLHGNTNKKEIAPDGGPDRNIFEIKQGVAISVMMRSLTPVSEKQQTIQRCDLFGTDTFKFDTLNTNTAMSLASQLCNLLPPEYIFDCYDSEKKAEYEQYMSLPLIFNQNGDPAPGIVTTHDEFAISFTQEEQIEKVGALLASRNEAEARQHFRLCSQNQWDYTQAKKELQDGKWQEEIVRVLYRPFDFRVTVFNRHVAVHRRERVSRHMLAGSNIGLTFMRQVAIGDAYTHFGVTTHAVDNRAFYSNKGIMSLAPLYLHSRADRSEVLAFTSWPKGRRDRRPNLNPIFVNSIASSAGLRFVSDGIGDLDATFGPEDTLAYIYAVFHSPGYRSRYEAYLKLDFPRVPMPGDVRLFRQLVSMGHKLVSLHLLQSPDLDQAITDYAGPKNPQVGRVGWSNGTVWLDAAKTNAREFHRATKTGQFGFHGVPEQVWDFHIGGYQVCHKWLKDRKGRMLSDEDIAHYQRIVVALNETTRIMTEIDKAIESYGGWPGAFQAWPAAVETPEETAKVIPFQPRKVEPKAEDCYVTCVPLVSLKVAAGGFSDPQYVKEEDFEWVEISSRYRLRKGMFVAQVAGKSMEPAIPNAAWCLFRAPVEGTRQGKTVLVQLRDTTDPETGQSYTVKRYKSSKVGYGELWRHEHITLEPVNPDFEPIVLSSANEGDLQVIAELVEVLEN